ncbi:uncharacterized protein [Tenebrio molitor]|uniref:uncharacterized protein n=1 Tax=Tenebrio molitor TaxID=7067 RepID=UPI0036246A8C
MTKLSSPGDWCVELWYNQGGERKKKRKCDLPALPSRGDVSGLPSPRSPCVSPIEKREGSDEKTQEMATIEKISAKEENMMETEIPENPENWETKSEDGKNGREKNPKKTGEKAAADSAQETEAVEMTEAEELRKKQEENTNRAQTSRAQTIKKVTMETDKALTEIAKAIKKEMGGKISFTKENQKKILTASGDIKNGISDVLLEVIGMQEEARLAEERATNAENQVKKLREQIRQLTEKKETQARQTQRNRERAREREREKKDLRGPSQKKLDQHRKELHEEAAREEAGNQEGGQNTPTAAPRSTPTPAPKKKKQKNSKARDAREDGRTERNRDEENYEQPQHPGNRMTPCPGGKPKTRFTALVSQGEKKKRLKEVLKKKQGVQVDQVKKLNPTITITGLGTEWKPEEVVLDI